MSSTVCIGTSPICATQETQELEEDTLPLPDPDLFGAEAQSAIPHNIEIHGQSPIWGALDDSANEQAVDGTQEQDQDPPPAMDVEVAGKRHGLKTVEWGHKWMPNEQTKRIDANIAAEEAAEAAALTAAIAQMPGTSQHQK